MCLVFRQHAGPGLEPYPIAGQLLVKQEYGLVTVLPFAGPKSVAQSMVKDASVPLLVQDHILALSQNVLPGSHEIILPLPGSPMVPIGPGGPAGPGIPAGPGGPSTPHADHNPRISTQLGANFMMVLRCANRGSSQACWSRRSCPIASQATPWAWPRTLGAADNRSTPRRTATSRSVLVRAVWRRCRCTSHYRAGLRLWGSA